MCTDTRGLFGRKKPVPAHLKKISFVLKKIESILFSKVNIKKNALSQAASFWSKNFGKKSS